MEQRLVNLEYQKWMIKLMGYQFNIQYRPGLENKAADGLSRISQPTSLLAMTVPHVLQMERLLQEVAADDRLQAVIRQLQANPTSQPNFW